MSRSEWDPVHNNLPFLLLVSADIDWRQHSGKELSAEIFL